ncbi:MAG: hypothetical protein JXC36_05295 [Candidatus Atribacteria bacterium]|nr:hypothetical protein [Candidatus Atribacteria bacterium]
MTPIYAALILIALVAIGDFISIITRARIPMLFTAFALYLILIWSGLPKDLMTISTIGPFGAMMIPVLIVHMGTLIPFNIITQQWKAIVVAFIAMAVAAIFMLLVASPIFGWNETVAGCPPVLGGIIAALVTIDSLKAMGLDGLIVIAATILAIQGLVGMPIASNLLKKYALKVREQYLSGGIPGSKVKNVDERPPEGAIDIVEEIPYGTDENPSPKYKALLPKKFESDSIMLLKLLIGGSIAVFLGTVIKQINSSIWAIVIGLAGAYFGIYRGRMLNRANSIGITMAALIIYIFVTMNNVTIEAFKAKFFPIIGILFIGTIGLILGGYISSWIVRWPKELTIAVALTAEFGFPGNYLISDEVSRSVSKNNKEKNAIFEYILPPMLVGGYATVTTGSILFATILVSTLK